MPEAKPQGSEIRNESFRFGTTTVLLLSIIVGFLVFSGIGEHLGAKEARFLNEVIDSGSDSTTIPVQLQSMWADFCGLMERPSRLLGLLSGALSLILMVSMIHQRGGASFLALAAAGAMGVAIHESCQIGGSAPVLLALCLVLFVLQRLLHLSLRPLAFLGILLVVGAQVGMGRLAPAPEVTNVWLEVGPDLAAWGLASWAGLSLFAGVLAASIIFANEPDGLLLVALPVAVAPLAKAFNIPLAPTAWVLAAYSLPLCLWLGIPRKSKKWKTSFAVMFLVVACLYLAIEIDHTRHASTGREERQNLDWIAEKIPQSAWLALGGGNKDIVRYYEHCGHRTGHRSILIRDEEELKALSRMALSEKPPVICMMGIDPKSVKELLVHYALEQEDGQPDGVLVARFRRRN